MDAHPRFSICCHATTRRCGNLHPICSFPSVSFTFAIAIDNSLLPIGETRYFISQHRKLLKEDWRNERHNCSSKILNLLPRDNSQMQSPPIWPFPHHLRALPFQIRVLPFQIVDNSQMRPPSQIWLFPPHRSSFTIADCYFAISQPRYFDHTAYYFEAISRGNILIMSND